MALRNRKQSGARGLSAEERSAVQAQLGLVTNLRADVAALESGEQRTLQALLRQARGNGNGSTTSRRHPDLSSLGKRDRKTAEKLIEKAAGASGAFEAERERAETQSRLDDLMARARRPRRLRHEEPGSLVLPAEFVSHIADGINSTDEVLAFVYVMAQLEAGRGFGMGCRLEDDALVLPQRGSLGPPGGDPEGRFAAKKRALSHLATNNWLVISQGGGGTTIRRGKRWLAAVERRERS